MLTALCVVQTDTVLDAAMDEGLLETFDQMDDAEEHVVKVTRGQPHVSEEEVPSKQCAPALCSHFASSNFPVPTSHPTQIVHKASHTTMGVPWVAI